MPAELDPRRCCTASTRASVDYGLLQGYLGQPLVMRVLMLLSDGPRAAKNRSKDGGGQFWGNVIVGAVLS
jgi:hypothetical protein